MKIKGFPEDSRQLLVFSREPKQMVLCLCSSLEPPVADKSRQLQFAALPSVQVLSSSSFLLAWLLSVTAFYLC